MSHLKSSPAPAPESISAATLSELHELDEDGAQEFFLELTALFAKTTSELLSHAYHTLDDPNELATIAHTIKGSCGYFGAHRLESLCLQLGQLNGAGGKGAAGELVAAIEREFLNVCAALERHCPSQRETPEAEGSSLR